MSEKNNKGAITVFVSIVLSAVFLVIGTFTDAARFRLAHSQVQRASKTALSSLLACYNNELKDEYGLFGLYLDSNALQESYEEYFKKNLNIYNEQNFLYGYSLENINVMQPYSLENREIFERQIMEFMKYRAPYEIASDLISKIKWIKNISSGSKLYKRKMETDKQASEIGELQLILEDKAKKINESGISSKLSDLKNKYINQNKSYNEFTKKLYDLKNLYLTEKDEENRKSILDDINLVKDEIDGIIRTKDEIKNTIINSVNEYKGLNSQAIIDAQAITHKKGTLLNRIEEEIEYTKDNLNGIEELQKSYKNGLSGIKKIIAEDNSSSIISNLEGNISKCDSIASKTGSNDSDFLSVLESLETPEQIGYRYNKAVPAESDDEDNRNEAIHALKAAFNSKGQPKVIDDSLLQRLPSRKAFRKEENEIETWDKMDFDNESCALNNLDNLSSKESRFEQLASKVTEELYINEYVMGMFKHDVPLLKGEDDKRAYNLRSKDKTKRNAFFSNYEVEYIINGNKNEEINSMLVKSEILSIRLISNVIHIYTDSSKMARVSSLAAALSTWSAGLSTPLIQTMLVFSWAMFESLYDMNELLKGEKILLFKTKDQWKTDMSGVIDKNKVKNVDKNPLCLSYQDYLKVFLLVMDKDKKLARIQDLVQLNAGGSSTGFMLEDCKVFLKADTTVSIKNLFVSFPLFTADTRRNISRTYIKDSMYMGY